MALSNRDRVGRAFEALATGLAAYVDRRVRNRTRLGAQWLARWADRAGVRGEVSMSDPSVLLRVMADWWDEVFSQELSKPERNMVFELRTPATAGRTTRRSRLDDAYRALDSIERLLAAIDATEAIEVGKAKDELMRTRYEAEARKATPKQEALLTAPAGGLRPWREVIVPHDDVARAVSRLAEFAADLHQVAHGRGAAEYADPVEFFRRTYLTDGPAYPPDESVAPRSAGSAECPVVDLPDQLRRRQDPFDDRPLPPVLRHAPRRASRRRCRTWPAPPSVERAAEVRAGGAGRHEAVAGSAVGQARRHRGRHPVGRARLAARWGRGLRARRRGRPDGARTRESALDDCFWSCARRA